MSSNFWIIWQVLHWFLWGILDDYLHWFITYRFAHYGIAVAEIEPGSLKTLWNGSDLVESVLVRFYLKFDFSFWSVKHNSIVISIKWCGVTFRSAKIGRFVCSRECMLLLFKATKAHLWVACRVPNYEVTMSPRLRLGGWRMLSEIRQTRILGVTNGNARLCLNLLRDVSALLIIHPSIPVRIVPGIDPIAIHPTQSLGSLIVLYYICVFRLVTTLSNSLSNLYFCDLLFVRVRMGHGRYKYLYPVSHNPLSLVMRDPVAAWVLLFVRSSAPCLCRSEVQLLLTSFSIVFYLLVLLVSINLRRFHEKVTQFTKKIRVLWDQWSHTNPEWGLWCVKLFPGASDVWHVPSRSPSPRKFGTS